MTFKYAGTVLEEFTHSIAQAVDAVNSLIRDEFNLNKFTVVSVSIDGTDIEFEFTSPSRVCVDDYSMLVEVK